MVAANDVLDEAAGSNLALVETGNFYQLRYRRLKSSVFEEAPLRSPAPIVGMSRSGRVALVSSSSGRHPSPNWSPDMIRAVSVDTGATLTTFEPDAPAIHALSAEISDDLAFLVIAGTIGPRNFGIHRVDAAGARRLVAMDESATPHSISISADGTRIVYEAAGSVMLVDSTGDRSVRLVSGDRPSWTPNGVWISYRNADGYGALVRPDGSQSVSLMDGTRIDGGFRWSPDGKFVLFSVAGSVRVGRMRDGIHQVAIRSLFDVNESRLRWIAGNFEGLMAAMAVNSETGILAEERKTAGYRVD